MRIGSKVRLKSGGPEMTVTSIVPGDPKPLPNGGSLILLGGSGQVICEWFDGEKLAAEPFFTVCLEEVP